MEGAAKKLQHSKASFANWHRHRFADHTAIKGLQLCSYKLRRYAQHVLHLRWVLNQAKEQTSFCRLSRHFTSILIIPDQSQPSFYAMIAHLAY